jgi:hypothetical protein
MPVFTAAPAFATWGAADAVNKGSGANAAAVPVETLRRNKIKKGGCFFFFFFQTVFPFSKH